MKWLATIFCLLTVSVAGAFENTPAPENTDTPQTKIVPLPFMMQCTSVPPDEVLKYQYGELGMLEGDAQVFNPNMKVIDGKMSLFVNPDDPRSFTLMLELAPDFHCIAMSGDNIQPRVAGTEL